MQDRAPTYPGRVTLTPVDGQPNIYDMARADQPTQAGTPINKATLLSDDTAKDYGLTDTAGATPNEAFQALKTNRRPWMIGDTLTTMRTDLGDDWLLCNGAYIDPDEYPDLAEVLAKELCGQLNPLGDDGNVFCVYQANGYLVVGGNSGGHPAIAYTDDLLGDWTIVNFQSWSAPNDFGVKGVIYADGQWCIVGDSYDNSQSYDYNAYIAYATTLDGDWTSGWIYRSRNSILVGGIAYANGYWAVAISYYTEYLHVLYANALNLDTSWNSYRIDSATLGAVPSGIMYDDGYWVVVGSAGNVACYWYASDLQSNEWTRKNAFTGTTNTSGTHLRSVFHANGYWVFFGGLFSSPGGFGQLVYATTIDGSLTSKSLWGSDSVDGDGYVALYADGYYLFAGGLDDAGILAFAQDIDGPYTTVDIPDGELTDGAYFDGYWVFACGAQVVFTKVPDAASGNVIPKLPNISLEAYTYIRAKE